MTRSPRVRDSPSWSVPLQHGINETNDPQDTQHSSSSNHSRGWLDALPGVEPYSGSLLNSISNSPFVFDTNPPNLDIQLELAPPTTFDFISPRNECNIVQKGVSNLFSSGATGLESGREEIVSRRSYKGGFEGNSFITHPDTAFEKGTDYLRNPQLRINSTDIYSIEPRNDDSDMSTENHGNLGLDEEQHPTAPELHNAPTTPLAQSQSDSSTLSMSWTTLTPSTLSRQPSRSTTYSITPETAVSKFAVAVNFGPCSKTWELPPRVSILQWFSSILYLLTLHEEAAA
jgi:hypothetical protein